MYEHAMRLGQEVSGLDSLQKQVLAALRNRPFSLCGHVESQENRKLCFCTASLAQTRIQCEASRAKTKLFILLRLNMAAD